MVISKTKVAPIKRLTIPRLELCGAKLLTQLLHHTQQALSVPTESVFAWTDSTIVLSWLIGNPCRFKTFVGNRVSHIMQLIPPDRWNHVRSPVNPADCASRGLFPSELLDHGLWWNGPDWLRLPSSDWPTQSSLPSEFLAEEERGNCLHTMANHPAPVISLDQFSSFLRLKRVTAWIRRFVDNCRRKDRDRPTSLYLSTSELMSSETYWLLFTQRQAFCHRDRNSEEWRITVQVKLFILSISISRFFWSSSGWWQGWKRSNAVFSHTPGDTSADHITSDLLRTLSTHARRTNASYSVSQSSILHHWWPEDYSFDYAWLYHLSTIYGQTKTPTSGPDSSQTHYARLSVRSSWSRLCRTVCLEIWINSQTLVHQSIRLPLRLANHQSSSPRISVRSFIHRCLATVHFSQRQALLDME